MRPIRAVLVSALCLAGSSHTAHGADPSHYDILTLRLTMSATEVLEQLHAQGIANTAMRFSPPDCSPAQADLCARTIRAHTRDGELLIQLARVANGPERQVVYRIAYTIVARGPADTDTLRADAIDRYGDPTSPATSTWCARLDVVTGTCPAGQPRLRIEPAPHAAALITLSDDAMLKNQPAGD